ncbi:MAG: hypothetical protein Q8Q39_04215, partial [bacterium]|nr:hypothetical protein [bacterium]
EAYYHALDDAIYDQACDGFVILPGWEGSGGARRDKARAENKGKPIFELKGYADEDMLCLLIHLHTWALGEEQND